MDPAGPRFVGLVPSKRLSADDALFVDIIHTDGGVLGYHEPMGHVDFFPNGGTALQNGCNLFDSNDYFFDFGFGLICASVFGSLAL